MALYNFRLLIPVKNDMEEYQYSVDIIMALYNDMASYNYG